MKAGVHDGEAVGEGVGEVNGCIVHGTRISSGAGVEAPADGGTCWMSKRMATGKVSAPAVLPEEFVELVEAVEAVEPAEELSEVLNDQLVCQFVPS
jgi:hypothetical protein